MSKISFYEAQVSDEQAVLKVTPAKIKLFTLFNVFALLILCPIAGAIVGVTFMGAEGLAGGLFIFPLASAFLMYLRKKLDDKKRKPVELVVHKHGVTTGDGELIAKENISFFKVVNRLAKFTKDFQLNQVNNMGSSPVLVAQAGTVSGQIIGATVMAQTMLEPGRRLEAAQKAFVVSISHSLVVSCRGKDTELVFGLSESTAEALANEISALSARFWR